MRGWTALLLAAAAASARAETGSLVGAVVDEGGAPLADVLVVLVSPALDRGTRARSTDAEGSFLFVGLPPGEYELTAEQAGFELRTQPAVRVFAGRTTTLTVTMSARTARPHGADGRSPPEIGAPRVELERSPARGYARGSPIGSDRGDPLAGAGSDAGLTEDDWFASLRTHLFGSTASENAYIVDGLAVLESAADRAGDGSTGARDGELLLRTGEPGADYGSAGRGHLDLATRSGGNRFAGSLDLRYSGRSFQQSGDRYDASELGSRSRRALAILGGPIVRDRAWFLASYLGSDDELTPVASPSTRDRELRSVLARLTWQIAGGWLLTAATSDDASDHLDLNASRWVMPEATARTRDSSTSFSADLDVVLSRTTLWTSSLGHSRYGFDSLPRSGDLETISHYNYVTGLETDNYSRRRSWTSSRDDLAAELTRYLREPAGSHELKVGFGYSDLRFTTASCSTGSPGGVDCVEGGVGFQFYDTLLQGEPHPLIMWERHTEGSRDYDGDLISAFAQDAWRPIDALTLVAGLRYDRIDLGVNRGPEIADMELVQPRIGVAWDLTDDARTRVRGSWGRFLSAAAPILPARIRGAVEPAFRWYSCSGLLPLYFGIPVSSAEECSRLASSFEWDYRRDDAGWDPFGWVLFPRGAYATEPNQIDPGLRPASDDELLLSFVRELGRDAVLELSYVDRRTRDLSDDTCNGNVPEPTYGSACDHYVFANLDGLERSYRGYVVEVRARALDRISLRASYTYSDSKGSVEPGEPTDQVADAYPWHFENRFGYLSEHRRHSARLRGVVELGSDWTIAFGAFWSSPFTWAPAANSGDDLEIPYGARLLEPRGRREGASSYQLDLRLARGWTLGPTRLELVGSVHNVLGDERPIQLCRRASGCGDFALGEPTAWQLPRRFEIGLRIEL